MGSGRGQKYNIFSILAIIFAFLFYPLGLIFAIIALVQIKHSGEKGKGLAITAIVLPPVLIVLAVIVVVLVWFFIGQSLKLILSLVI